VKGGRRRRSRESAWVRGILYENLSRSIIKLQKDIRRDAAAAAAPFGVA